MVQKWRFLLPCAIVWKMNLCFEPPGQFDKLHWGEDFSLKHTRKTVPHLKEPPCFLWFSACLTLPLNPSSLGQSCIIRIPVWLYLIIWAIAIRIRKMELKIYDLVFPGDAWWPPMKERRSLLASAFFQSPVHDFVFPHGACFYLSCPS